jgi:glycosyltransferase involved in cell wall biosynthesis
MACGLPIVATAVPGIAEILGDEVPLPGISVPVADVAALTAALQSLLGNIDVSRDLGFRAKKRAHDFSLATVGADLRSFLLARAKSFHKRVLQNPPK